MTICYTIAVYMVYSFLTDKADETRIGTLTGLLVGGQPFSLPVLCHWPGDAGVLPISVDVCTQLI